MPVTAILISCVNLFNPFCQFICSHGPTNDTFRRLQQLYNCCTISLFDTRLNFCMLDLSDSFLSVFKCMLNYCLSYHIVQSNNPINPSVHSVQCRCIASTSNTNEKTETLLIADSKGALCGRKEFQMKRTTVHCTGGRFQGFREVQVVRIQTGGAQSTRACQEWESPAGSRGGSS